MIRKRRLWKWATLSIGTPLGKVEEGSFTGDFVRPQYLGSFFLDPENIRSVSLVAI